MRLFLYQLACYSIYFSKMISWKKGLRHWAWFWKWGKVRKSLGNGFIFYFRPEIPIVLGQTYAASGAAAVICFLVISFPAVIALELRCSISGFNTFAFQHLNLCFCTYYSCFEKSYLCDKAAFANLFSQLQKYRIGKTFWACNWYL